jgi:hypothetical protein
MVGETAQLDGQWRTLSITGGSAGVAIGVRVHIGHRVRRTADESGLGAGRVPDGVDPQIARYAFDMGNLGFANAWVALAGFLAAAGWIMVGTPSLPSWLGWVAIVAAFGFLLGRAFWTTSVWLIPYAVFWIWVVALSIYLFRGRVPGRTG